ncbi:MAG: hypothetical protein HYX76_07525 [Acidobacteria bacterium]|nr:hypothetical protein [Acidobacteriota bacterium]
MKAPDLFLAMIAVATALMALLQVGALVYAGRLARRWQKIADDVERDVKPLIARVTAISADAARVASLASAQAERIDRLVADLAYRAEQTVAEVQSAIIAPAREGRALVSGLRAALAALRGLRSGHTGASGRGIDDEDALFIG